MPFKVARWTRPEGTTLRVVLVRHGEPEASARGRCYGRLDVDLSPRGRRQMRRVALLLERAPLTAVYCSPHRRARESGQIVAAPHRLAPQPEVRFREIDFGSLEGLTYDQAAARFPEIYKAWMERPTEVEFPGGESLSTMRARVVAAAVELMGTHRGHTVAIVSHGGVGRILLGEALGLDARHLFRMEQSYGAVSVIDYYGAAPLVRLFNAVPTRDLGLRC
jgi:broad specificity phosphatase PhoE